MPIPHTKLSTRHCVALPKEVRDTLDWKPGEDLSVERHKDGVFIYKRPTLEDVFGIAKGANTDFQRDRDDRY